MGLTIHYEQKNKAEKIDIKKAQECIDFVEFIADREGWDVLGKWNKVIKVDDFEIPSWHEQPKDIPRGIARNIGISVHPHKDCESLVIAFDTTNGKFRLYEDYGRPNEKGSIYDSQFCKTHYAGFATHKKVCRLLDAISKRYLELEVSDEGDYYGVWDDVKGKKVFGEYIAFVKGVGEQLAGEFGKENMVSAADNTDGWKDDYIDHLAEDFKQKKGGKKTAYKGYVITINREGYITKKNGLEVFTYDGTEPTEQLLAMAKADIDNFTEEN